MASSVEIDNDRVRVTRWTLREGEETGPHRHERDYVVVPLTRASMCVTLPDGSTTTNDLAPGSPYFRMAGAEHNVRNPGTDLLDFVEVELV